MITTGGECNSPIIIHPIRMCDQYQVLTRQLSSLYTQIEPLQVRSREYRNTWLLDTFYVQIVLPSPSLVLALLIYPRPGNMKKNLNAVINQY